ncbi:hypothetical protein CAL26_01300 [Bordetella genomosp. 9]|uniref:Uncharacterized protein n=3 Tax=Bordetella TaxID=517 RepID=A0A261RN52_9BORD|nr:hypothetical protein BAU08_19565 [Bordetella bronchialis]ARP82936.1 hypothetical protein CAL12_20365 [Bordetella genomosp. 8]OZI26020.1 hypothetical protein CAL26_01300 [Bordetella genomosp. 9]
MAWKAVRELCVVEPGATPASRHLDCQQKRFAGYVLCAMLRVDGAGDLDETSLMSSVGSPVCC